MYYVKTSKTVSAVVAVFGLVLALAQLTSKVAATNSSLPSHVQARVRSEPPASAARTNGKIAFIRYISGVSGLSDSLDDIYVMNPDGSNQRRLTFTQNLCGSFQAAYSFGPVWSPDGKKIAF